LWLEEINLVRNDIEFWRIIQNKTKKIKIIFRKRLDNCYLEEVPLRKIETWRDESIKMEEQRKGDFQ
jgi:hypothetical protein